MSKGSLKISDALTLPLNAAVQTFAFIARKGAGKSYGAMKLTEQLLHKKVQCVVLDTVGNWYGLRISADGKGKGFDIPIFGGLRGDLPLQASAGELVADVVVETGHSVILDISQFSIADRKRFATSFGERLWKNKKAQKRPTPMMLIIEESQLIVPQFPKGSERMLGIYEEIIRLGRNFGIGITMISQRPQSVNKEVLNQTECLFVLQVNGSQERKALREWIVYQGMDVNLLSELPSLPIGTAYVWSPQWLGILKKIKFAKKETLDSTATPKVGSRVLRRDPAKLNLGEIEEKMSAMVEQAKRDDPRELQKQVYELQRQLNARPKEIVAAPERIVERRVEVPVLNGEVKELRALFSKFEGHVKTLREATDLLGSIDTLLERTNVKIDSVKDYKPVTMDAPKVTAPTQPATAARPKTPEKYEEPASEDTTVPKLRAGQRDILRVLKQFHPRALTDSQIRLLIGDKVSSRTYGMYMSVLRTNKLVRRVDGEIVLTHSGYELAGEVDAVRSSPEGLFSRWAKELRAGQRQMVRRGLDAYPQWILLDDMRAEMPDVASNTFNMYLSGLKSIDLIEVQDGQFRASESFFMS